MGNANTHQSSATPDRPVTDKEAATVQAVRNLHLQDDSRGTARRGVGSSRRQPSTRRRRTETSSSQRRRQKSTDNTASSSAALKRQDDETMDNILYFVTSVKTDSSDGDDLLRKFVQRRLGKLDDFEQSFVPPSVITIDDLPEHSPSRRIAKSA